MLIFLVVIFLVITYLLAKQDVLWGVGWLTFLVPSYIVRLSIFGIPTNALELGIYVVVLVWAIKLLRKKSRWSGSSFDWWPSLLLLVSLVSILIVSDDKKMSLGLWKGWLLDPILLYFVVKNEFKRIVQLAWVRSGFVFLVAMLGMIGFWQWLTGNIDTTDGRLAVFFSSANYLAMLLVPGLIVLLAIFLVEKRWRWWELVIWGIGVWALIATGSYISVVAFVLAAIWLGMAVWRKKTSLLLWVILGGVLVTGMFLGTQWGSERMNSMIDLSSRSSVTVRLQVWQTAWALVEKNPVWGIGLGNFEKKYLEYLPKVVTNPLEWRMLHAHNFWLQSWLTVSIFGLLIFGVIIIYNWWLGLRLLKRFEGKNWFLYAFLGYLLSLILIGLLDTPYYKNDFSFICWLMIGILNGLAGNILFKKKKVEKSG